MERLEESLNTASVPNVHENGQKNHTNDSLSCTGEFGEDVGGHSERVNCSFEAVFKGDCFYDIPTREEWNLSISKSQKVLEMAYTLRQLEETDFDYVYQVYVGTSSSRINDTAVVRLLLDLGDKERALRIGIAIGATALVLIIAGCAVYIFRLHIRVAWKRSNCVKYEKDLMEYGAYLAYYWSNEGGENEELEAYRELINGMRECIERLDFKIYDPAENPFKYQWQPQNIKLVQENCDRVVVVLTSQFLDEANAEQDLFTNFLEKKFILVTTPDFHAAFKNLKENVKNGLNAHFQRNYTIKWPGKGGELSKRMRMEFELAMPKKRKETDSRLV